MSLFKPEDLPAELGLQQSGDYQLSPKQAQAILDLKLHRLTGLEKDKKIHEARAFNFTYRYIDDVLSINNSRFAEFLPLIYPPELLIINFSTELITVVKFEV
jgi:DNA gyrase/topoisomerase IV subunit A